MKRILITNFPNKEGLETIIKEIIAQEYIITYRGEIALLEIYEDNKNFDVPIINSDIMMEYRIMYVPLFDDFTLKLFSQVSSPGIYNAYQILVKSLINQKIAVSDLPDYFANISPEIIQLVKIFIENDLNASLTARTMYLHRNTMNYRLENFKIKTGIDIKEHLNANFIYLLLTLR